MATGIIRAPGTKRLDFGKNDAATTNGTLNVVVCTIRYSKTEIFLRARILLESCSVSTRPIVTITSNSLTDLPAFVAYGAPAITRSGNASTIRIADACYASHGAGTNTIVFKIFNSLAELPGGYIDMFIPGTVLE